MHKPKAFLPLVALSLHRMLHPLLFPRLLKPVADAVEHGLIELDWETNAIKNCHPPQKKKQCSSKPVARTCCLEGAVQLSLFLQFNVAWPISPARYPGVKEQSVLDFFFFSCGQDCLLWTPVEASPVTLLSRSSGDLVCDTPLFDLHRVHASGVETACVKNWNGYNVVYYPKNAFNAFFFKKKLF